MAKTKYLLTLIETLKSRKAGILKNKTLWENQPVNDKTLDGHIEELDKFREQIEDLEDQLRQVQKKARESVSVKEEGVLQQVDNIAIGLHNSDPEKLNEYNIKLRKPAAPKPLPVKAIIKTLEDDADGEGFVITITAQRNIADFYEIQKGIAPNASDKVLAPPYPFYKSTKRIVITDDDVESGKRYFYRVRAVNATGAGEWSEPVSRVQ